MNPLNLKLLRDIWRRRWTMLALICVLALGVASYISLAGVYSNLNDATNNYYAKYHLADFTINLKRAPNGSLGQLNNVPNVARLQSRIDVPIMATLPVKAYSSIKKPIPGEAISLPAARQAMISGIKLAKGRRFSSDYAHEVILNAQFANARNLVPGDRISVRLPGKSYNLLVVGTAYAPEFVMMMPPGMTLAPDPAGFAVMYLPVHFLDQRANLSGAFNQLLGLVNNNSDTAINNTMWLLSKKLDQYGVIFRQARKNVPSVLMLHDELQNIQSFVAVFPTIFFLVAALVLNVMIGRLVLQQRSVIGTLKALGYGNWRIMRHYLAFGFVIGVLGAILGIIFGSWLQNAMLNMYRYYFTLPNMHFSIAYDAIGVGIIISIISAIIGTISGAKFAMRLTPAEAMRPPAPEMGRHLLLEKVKGVWTRLSFTKKMVLRSISRNRFRSLVTVLAVILATTIIYSSLEFFDSIDKMMDFSFTRLQHQDYTLTFRDPLGRSIMRPLEILPGVGHAEAQLNVPAQLTHGPYHRLLSLTGLPKNHKLFTPIDSVGNPININDAGVVLSSPIAKILHAKVGDLISVRPLLGNRKMIKVPVSNIVTTYLGMSVYANLEWLSKLLGDSWLTSSVLFKMGHDANLLPFIRAVNKFEPMTNLVSLKYVVAQYNNSWNQFLSVFITFLVAFACVVAMGAIINTAMISLNERERDIASLRVMGFSTWQVAKIFFGESIILNSVGIVIGLLGGIGMAYYYSIAYSTDMYRMPVVITGSRLMQGALIAIICVIVSQLLIYHVIKKLNWFDVLNNRE